MSRSRGRIVKWVPEARDDIQRHYHFLRRKYREAATRAVKSIMEAEELLKSFPCLGRPLADGSDRRELSLSFGAGSYVLRYMLEDEDTIIILRVWHSREEREE